MCAELNPSIDPALSEQLSANARDAVEAGYRFVLAEQGEDGLWNGRTEATVRATSQLLLLLGWFGLESSDTAANARNWICDQATAHLDRFDVDDAALARLALHLTGEPTKSVFSLGLEDRIAGLGGVRAFNSLTRLYYALFDQVDFSICEPNCPEAVVVRNRLPGGRWSAHSNRTFLVPSAILMALKPRKIAIPKMSFLATTSKITKRNNEQWSARLIVSCADRLRFLGMRGLALRVSQRWILSRISAVSGLGGSISGTALSAIALNCLGYERTSPAVTRCFESIHNCIHDDGSVARANEALAQSALGIRSIANIGSRGNPQLVQALEAVLAEEAVRESELRTSDGSQFGGWSREQDNDHNPNVNCTADLLVAMRSYFSSSPAADLVSDDSMVAMIRANTIRSARQRIALLDRVAAASRRARRWLIATQRRDGSWRDSDSENHESIVTTAKALLALGTWEMRIGQRTIDRAVQFLRKSQGDNGVWGREDRLDLYATMVAIEGLLSVGVPKNDPSFVDAKREIVSRQRPDGSFQVEGHDMLHATTWAMTALAALESHHGSLARATHWLIYQQQPGGDWPTAQVGTALDSTSQALLALCGASSSHRNPQQAKRSDTNS